MSNKSHKKSAPPQPPPAEAEETAAGRTENASTRDAARNLARTRWPPRARGLGDAVAAAVESLVPEPSGANLQAQLDEAQDRYLRLQAEVENVRKRLHRTVEEERRYASLPLMRDLLPVLDNLQRAIQAAEQHENATALLDGVKLVASQLEGVLQRHHCVPIKAQDVPFDPHLHEAIAQQPHAEHEPGHVAWSRRPVTSCTIA